MDIDITLPTPEQRQKIEFTIRNKRVRRKYSTVLEKYAALDRITPDQADAGNRLYSSAVNGGVLNSTKAIDYSRVNPDKKNGSPNISWKQAMCHKAFLDALY